MFNRSEALNVHKKHGGKLEILPRVLVSTSKDLSLVYSPGVAEPCLEIYNDSDKVYDYTIKGNHVAVVTNGTAVLGLGNIGPAAALPVMEGKVLLLKSFAGVDGFPICLNSTESNKIIETVKLLEPTFGGIILEDIAAPECFEIEERLKEECRIPVFHDDQHGTAIVAAAGLINALKLVRKSMKQIRIVINGAGAAGIAITKLLQRLGATNILLCDTNGIIYEGRPKGMNAVKDEIAKMTNLQREKGTLEDALRNADVFLGVSAAGTVSKEMIKSMNRDPIIFAMANPNPEVMPEEAIAAGARVVGTGRSDYPNQVNNVLAFPGIFRGVLDVRATEINDELKLAAVYAIANLISASELKAEYVIPHPFDQRVAPHVARAVAKAAIETGIAKVVLDPERVKEKTEKLVRRDDAVGSYYSWYLNMTT